MSAEKKRNGTPGAMAVLGTLPEKSIIKAMKRESDIWNNRTLDLFLGCYNAVMELTTTNERVDVDIRTSAYRMFKQADIYLNIIKESLGYDDYTEDE